MKKIKITVLFTLLISTAYSQVTFFNYFDYTSEWKYYASGYGTSAFVSYETVYFDGYENINGKAYYKQYRKITQTNYGNPSQTYTENFLYGPGYVREDSDGKVWYLGSDNVENLSFDNQAILAAQIGDPFPSQSEIGYCLVTAYKS